jgi:glycosyltransferase involved in cell wall biosynthesis
LIEVIVVNDGSQDNTREIIETYAEKDHRINVIHKQENQGKSKAIIDALERVTGEYVTLLDSDDWINENYYTEIKKKLVNAPEVLIAGYILEPGGKKICTHYKIDCMMSGIDLVKSNPLVHTSYDASFSWRMFFKTALLKENHFMPDTKIVIGEDTEFNLRVLKIAKKTLAVDCASYHYRTNNQNSLVHQSYKPTLENDLNLQYPTRRNFCKEKNIYKIWQDIIRM